MPMCRKSASNVNMERARFVISTSVVVGVSVLILFGIYRYSKRRRHVGGDASKKTNDLEHEATLENEPTEEKKKVMKAKSDTQLCSVPQPSSSQLSSQEAEVLVNMMSASVEEHILQKVLTTVGNSAAFTTNQDTLREAGALPRLNSLLHAHSMALKVGQSVTYPAVVSGVISSINNMAVNQRNQTHLKDCIPALIDFASTDKADESIQLASLQALTNLSVQAEYHEPYTKLIQQLYEYLDRGTDNIRLQAIKVLANLSTNNQMVPHLLAAKAPRCLFELLAPDGATDILIRWTTTLANVMCVVKEQEITACSLPPEYKAPSPETTHTALYGHNNINKLKSKVFILSRHSDSDVRHQASRIYGCLT